MESQKIKCETIIIGGGIAGLACALKLSRAGKEFKLITENIGGRIISSDDGKVNYGAWYVGKDYNNVLPYVRKERRVKKLDIAFHEDDYFYTILSKKLFFHPLQVFRLVYLLSKFRKEYKKFKKDTENISQKEAIESSQYFSKLYNQKASEFIVENKIEDIVKDFMEKILHGTTFTDIGKLNAFSFLQFCLPLIVPVCKFTFLKDKLIKPFESNIEIDSVSEIIKKDDFYEIRTKDKKTYLARNVVVATPIYVSQKLLNLEKINDGINAHMFHIRGAVKNEWRKRKIHVFGPESETPAISKEIDGTYLFYSKTAKPNFEKYFEKYEIIKKKFWNPAFNLIGGELLKVKQDSNLYLIGDYNVCGLEDSFITGIYAANQIVKKI